MLRMSESIYVNAFYSIRVNTPNVNLKSKSSTILYFDIIIFILRFDKKDMISCKISECELSLSWVHCKLCEMGTR